MKAKEWAVKFSENSQLAMIGFMGETNALMEKRGRQPSVLAGIFREQTQKYRAICRLLPDLDPDAVYFAYEKVFDAEYEEACKFEGKQYRRKLDLNDIARNRKERADALKEPDPQLRLIKLLAVCYDHELKRQENVENAKVLWGHS